MSSIETGLADRPNMPFSSVMDRVAATTSNRPGSTSTKLTRSPALTRSALRTSAGMVTVHTPAPGVERASQRGLSQGRRQCVSAGQLHEG